MALRYGVGHTKGRSTERAMSANMTASTTDREMGLAVHAEAMQILTSPLMTETLQKLGKGVAGLPLERFLSDKSASGILADMQQDAGWAEECWALDEDEDVHPVSVSEFEATRETLRFSRNECLRKPSATAWCLRGLLSAITSEEVRLSLSKGFGCDVKFKSVDMAR